MSELSEPIEIDLRDSASVTPRTPTHSHLITSHDARSALQWLRDGAYDETIRLEVPSSVRAAISPLIMALRWGTLLLGMVFAVTRAANDGELGVVVTLAIIMFLTIWRTFRPLRLSWSDTADRVLPITDAMIIGAAIGFSDGFDSPFIFCLLAAVTIAAFGWGFVLSFASLGAGVFMMLIIALISDSGFNLNDRFAYAVLLSMLLVPAIAAFARARLVEAEARRQARTGQLNALNETNDLLGILNQVARTLPASLDLREALNATRSQLTDSFGATSIGLLSFDEHTNSWVPQIAEGAVLQQNIKTSDLPRTLAQALIRNGTVQRNNPGPEGLNPRSKSGLYTPLISRGVVTGLLAIESTEANRYGDRDRRVVDGLGEALGLTLDNARRFGRLRAIGGDDERARMARDLHDRLTQWLTFVSYELQSIMDKGEAPAPRLTALHGEVEGAIAELRETLRQIQAEVTADKPLAVLLDSLLRRFEERTGVETRYFNRSGGSALAVDLENGLLHIVQEALNNVEKHAQASEVTVSWKVARDGGVLEVTDNGQGFDTRGLNTDTSYGLVSMRERADVIDAGLEIVSNPSRGTTVRVVVSEPAQIAAR